MSRQQVTVLVLVVLFIALAVVVYMSMGKPKPAPAPVAKAPSEAAPPTPGPEAAPAAKAPEVPWEEAAMSSPVPDPFGPLTPAEKRPPAAPLTPPGAAPAGPPTGPAPAPTAPVTPVPPAPAGPEVTPPPLKPPAPGASARPEWVYARPSVFRPGVSVAPPANAFASLYVTGVVEGQSRMALITDGAQSLAVGEGGTVRVVGGHPVVVEEIGRDYVTLRYRKRTQTLRLREGT